jgi:hypothetical protein
MFGSTVKEDWNGSLDHAGLHRVSESGGAVPTKSERDDGR